MQREFSLLARAAGWTGGIANQNRGTLGGNIVNASPAADSLPALLAYEAELILVSVRGERRLPYRDFHTGYKKTKLAADESDPIGLPGPTVLGIFCLYAQSWSAQRAGHFQSLHRGAGTARRRRVEDVRIALGSVAPVPLRLAETERAVTGKQVEPSLLALAKKTAIAEIRPIDDIRSTVRYRSAVAANLVAEFLEKLSLSGSRHKTKGIEDMSRVAGPMESPSAEEAVAEILPCCGSKAWAIGDGGTKAVLRTKPLC